MSRGFTLLEIVVVMGLVVIIGWLLSGVLKDIFYHNFLISRTLVTESQAKMAMSRLTSELRRAQVASTGAYPIEEASTSTLTFYSDLDNSGQRIRVRYFLDGQVFKKGTLEPTGEPLTYNLADEKVIVIAENFLATSSSIFTYYDSNYDGASSSPSLGYPIEIKDIRLVKIDFWLESGRASLGQPFYLSSQVMLRNLKDNL